MKTALLSSFPNVALPGGQQTPGLVASNAINILNYRLTGRLFEGAAKVVLAHAGDLTKIIQRKRMSKVSVNDRDDSANWFYMSTLGERRGDASILKMPPT